MTITHKTTLQTTTSVSQVTLRPFLSILLIITVALLTALSAHARPVASAATASATISGIENLPAGLLPFPENIKKLQRVGIPSFLKPDFEFFTAVQSLISVELNPSTGVHIGNGTILTNRHVYMSLLRTDGLKTKFKGDAPIARLITNRKMSLLELPEPSAEDLKALAKKPGEMVLTWTDVSKYNDWVILQDPTLIGKSAFNRIRSSATLTANEKLWILGRPRGGSVGHIAAGTFATNFGNVSIIHDIDLMGGFSGSPVVDNQGSIVGLVFGYNPISHKVSFMNIEAVLKNHAPITAPTIAPVIIPVIKPEPNNKQTVSLDYEFINNNKKQTVVFLHGSGDTRETFSALKNSFANQYNILSYDQRGHGKSLYEGADFKVSTMANDLLGLIQKLKLQQIHLVGHSFGGRIAINFAASYPGLVKSVVVEDMEMLARQTGGEDSAAQLGKQLLAINKTYPNVGAAVTAIESVYGTDPSFLSDILSKSFIAQGADGSVTLTSTSHQAYLWGNFANAVNLGPSLKMYPGPVLFLRADASASALSAAGLQQIQNIKPKAEVESVPGSSHYIHLSHPQQFTELVQKFLKKTALGF